MAGCFGIVHDQVTYTISPEYFTRMKFDQFRGADFGFPPRVLVAEIGFLATWWVGLIAGWFLARVALPRHDKPALVVGKAMGTMMAVAIGFGFAGYLIALPLLDKRDGWEEALESMGVRDRRAFLRVAGIHLGSYAGALLAWIWLMWRIIRRKKSRPSA